MLALLGVDMVDAKIARVAWLSDGYYEGVLKRTYLHNP